VEVDLLHAGDRVLYRWNDPEEASRFIDAWERARQQMAVTVDRNAGSGGWQVHLRPSADGGVVVKLEMGSREEALWVAAHLSLVEKQ
jgi:hypothetical protein